MRRNRKLSIRSEELLLKTLFALLIMATSMALPSIVEAQEGRRFEISPFVGWRQGGDLADVATGLAVDLETGTAYGFMADFSVTSNLQIEFVWSETKSEVQIGLIPGAGLPEVSFPLLSVYAVRIVALLWPSGKL